MRQSEGRGSREGEEGRVIKREVGQGEARGRMED